MRPRRGVWMALAVLAVALALSDAAMLRGDEEAAARELLGNATGGTAGGSSRRNF
jgi:hypothetical protein